MRERITAEEARTASIDVIEKRRKLLFDEHFSKTVEEIDGKIKEGSDNGQMAISFSVLSDSPCWNLRDELKEEYENRGFEFQVYDQVDNPNFEVPLDGSAYNNSISIHWRRFRM